MMLCIGSAADGTFVHTLSRFAELGADFDALDLPHIALAGSIGGPVANAAAVCIGLADRTYRIGDYDAVFIRAVDVSSQAPSTELAERASAVFRILSDTVASLPSRVVNRSNADISNAAKLYHQISVARQFGLRSPRSLLTTDTDEAIDFASRCTSGAIVKGSSARKTWVSQIPDDRRAETLSRVAECPSLIQEYVRGIDIRVHVVHDRCFAEAIESHGIDYRHTRSNTYSAFRLPRDLHDICVSLTNYLGLEFAGIDFKADDRAGEFLFLEANSMPCYEGYDSRAGGEISAALHEWLAADR